MNSALSLSVIVTTLGGGVGLSLLAAEEEKAACEPSPSGVVIKMINNIIGGASLQVWKGCHPCQFPPTLPHTLPQQPIIPNRLPWKPRARPYAPRGATSVARATRWGSRQPTSAMHCQRIP